MGKGNNLHGLLAACEAQGFTVKRTTKGHFMVFSREGKPVTTIAGTPSDHRSWLNALAPLKRAGLIWPPPR